ncbi:hypothetical protein XELAEV_18038000mg [Xenopus laevis]|uniref:Uncharacterized protein n=1 Tax=Xenopus laevis TaxID=8355 RepID=A0A974CEC6_XENLA|nr:hypothetical protein XELAEV_18038000mg [Xenopus laevis]
MAPLYQSNKPKGTSPIQVQLQGIRISSVRLGCPGPTGALATSTILCRNLPSPQYHGQQPTPGGNQVFSPVDQSGSVNKYLQDLPLLLFY